MSRPRMVVSIVIGTALVILLGWQLHRERLVKVCLARGGAWDGSACGPPTLRRDLQRS